MYFSPYNVCIFSFIVLNQCKMLVANRGSGSGSVKSVLVNQFSRALPGWGLGAAPPQYIIINEIIKLWVRVNYNHRLGHWSITGRD